MSKFAPLYMLILAVQIAWRQVCQRANDWRDRLRSFVRQDDGPTDDGDLLTIAYLAGAGDRATLLRHIERLTDILGRITVTEPAGEDAAVIVVVEPRSEEIGAVTIRMPMGGAAFLAWRRERDLLIGRSETRGAALVARLKRCASS